MMSGNAPLLNLDLLMWYVPLVGLIGLLAAWLIFVLVSGNPIGNDKMRKIAAAIHQGAMAYLGRAYTTLIIFVIAVSVILGVFIKPFAAVAFICGAVSSMAAGWFGMKAATRANVRTAQAATVSQAKALGVAFFGGSVMGLSIASLGVLGLGVFYLLFKDPVILSGFSMGASSIAIFARVGGGIYTKTADVGADLVGKVEAGIPEDDPRNPAVIADNVGDNVGDVAGMGADLFESYAGSVVAAVALAITVAAGLNLPSAVLEMLPIILIALGTLSSLIAVVSFKVFERSNPASALRYATYLACGLFTAAAFLFINYACGSNQLFWSVLSGIVSGIAIGLFSEIYTSGAPIREVAKQGQSGPATLILSGFSWGFHSTVLPIITLCAAVFISYFFGGGLYGIAIAGVGMLGTIGITMSADAYGPIADNAGGIAEMSGLGAPVRAITDKLDSLGNTTAAIGKGFAIGSAALTALALFAAFTQSAGLTTINILDPSVVIGMFLGALLVFVFIALTIQAVGRAAFKMVEEVRRQFREITGLMEGKAEPDNARCVDISTKAALKEMILPGLLAVTAPLLMGFFFGVEALGGFLAGATVCGVIMAIFLANAGAIWDNAKKFIEAGNLGGKKTPTHAAAVVGDTVGDPFKDTAGPSINILIKLMAIVSLVFGPLLVKFQAASFFNWLMMK